MPLALARDGVFPRWFGAVNRKGMPVRAQLIGSALAITLIAANYTRGLTELFGFMALLATVATLVLYLFAAVSALRLMMTGQLRSGLMLIVTLVGAAGMYTFENDSPRGPGLNSYGAALWWTAMIMTTMGSEYWPQTGEGRLLCFFLALYSFAVFGYVTATLATFFIGRDAESAEGELAGTASIAALQAEIASLRDEIRALGR